MVARKASIPRVGSHNDIVQGKSSQNNRDSIMMDEEEIKEPVSTFCYLSSTWSPFDFVFPAD